VDEEKINKAKAELLGRLKKRKLSDEELEKKLQEELDKIQNVKTHIEKLNWQEEVALGGIDALKEELVNMVRIKRESGKDSFELCPEKKNKMHDDRAYTMCMCSYALQVERRKNITRRRRPKPDAKKFVSSLTMKKGRRSHLFEN
jgi:hypothetical protein